ncbi:rhodanese domain-containing protein CG4456-like isoform X2 [Onthophagus taurus]
MSTGNDENIILIDEVRALKDNPKVFFVDVREPHEIEATGLIPGSINIPFNLIEDVLNNNLKKGIRDLDLETPIVFTCRSGRRAGLAQEIAWKLGFKNVKNYKGSWLEWEKNHQ